MESNCTYCTARQADCTDLPSEGEEVVWGFEKEKLVWFPTCHSSTEFVQHLWALHARTGADLRCGEVSPGPPSSSAMAAATNTSNTCGRDRSPLAASKTQVANFTLRIRSLNENLCTDLFLSATFSRICCVPWCPNLHQPTGPSFRPWKKTCCTHLWGYLVYYSGKKMDQPFLFLFLITLGFLFRAFNLSTTISCYKPNYSSTLITFITY